MGYSHYFNVIYKGFRLSFVLFTPCLGRGRGIYSIYASNINDMSSFFINNHAGVKHMKKYIIATLVVFVVSLLLFGFTQEAKASSPGGKPPKDNKFPGGTWEFTQSVCKPSTSRQTCEQYAKTEVSCPVGEEVSKIDCNSGAACAEGGVSGNYCHCGFNCAPKKKPLNIIAV